ncbi:MAG: hypothetical protein Kow00109_06700 [Acidobacteriota bacterium]
MSTKPTRHAVILAAGKGTRFRSDLPKVLHPLCGRPMIVYLLELLAELGVTAPVVVVGAGKERVEEALRAYNVRFAEQREQKGTADAVRAALPELRRREGCTLVLYGDTPFVPRSALEALFTACEGGADEALLTVELDDPTGNGRILRDSAGNVADIVEEKDADAETRRIREVNAGFVCFRIPSLLQHLADVTNDNAAGEYYLTDLVRILRKAGKRVVGIRCTQPEEIVTINDRVQLARAERWLRSRINRSWMLEGVTLLNPETILIEPGVRLEPDSLLEDGVALRGETTLARGVRVGAGAQISRSRIGAGSVLGTHAVVKETEIADSVTVGAGAYIERSVLGRGCRVGAGAIIIDSQISEESEVPPAAVLERRACPR